MSIVATPDFTVEPTVAATTGLDFPGTGVGGTTIRFEFATASGTTPMDAYPATYIWKCYPKYQDSFYTAFFHGPNDGGSFAGGEYYGFHPYIPWPDQGATPAWEIAAGGTDTTGADVVFDQWYTQVAICYKSGGRSYLTFYWDWPNTTTRVITADFANASPPSPNAIMVGDASWDQGSGSGVGWEVWYGYLRGYQWYDAQLSEADVANELATPGSVRTPWYLKLNPTPTDITDDSGSGNDPSWVGANRPTLWTP